MRRRCRLIAASYSFGHGPAVDDSIAVHIPRAIVRIVARSQVVNHLNDIVVVDDAIAVQIAVIVLEGVEEFVPAHDVQRARREHGEALVSSGISLDQSSVPSGRISTACPGMLNQDSPHRLRSGHEEMSQAVPVQFLVADESNVRLVNKSCGLEGVADPFAGNPLLGNGAQTVVNQRQELPSPCISIERFIGEKSRCRRSRCAPRRLGRQPITPRRPQRR